MVLQENSASISTDATRQAFDYIGCGRRERATMGAPECRRSGARRVYRHIGWGEAAGIEDAEKQCAVAGDGSKYRNCKFNLHFLIKFP